MVCMQIFPVILSGLFNGGWNIYTFATYEMVKNADLLSKEYLFQSTIALLAYLGSSARFYLFLIASSRFRQVTKRWICFWRLGHQAPSSDNLIVVEYNRDNDLTY
ncbi:unnamed protein product [Rotaria sp. Silwood1]|nr:unnamed protein product [Rotaria sp. Silwood1]